MKVKVNDVEIELSPGTSAIDAVFAAGYDVPYFCSQEYMSPIGACRMCLAKVGSPRKDRETGEWVMDEATGEPKIFWMPNPAATCTTAIAEGMVIDTLAPEAVKAQRGMMEMTLINHPLDCPTCDKGGACELQDRAYEYGSGLSRFEFDKRHQEKHHALSSLITLDRERCIHCKRCVRYFEEVPGDEVLDFIERGGHTYIGSLEEELPSNFSGNITDICPVGALLDTTSRFRGRNWEYDHTRSTSLDDCSGSAIMIDARTGRIERIKAALNTQVNKTWIDDGTRFGHEYVDSEDRIKTPYIRKDGELQPASWSEAMTFINERIEAMNLSDIGVVIRADATLEEGVAARALAEHLETGALDHYPRYPASVISRHPATIEDVATSDALFVIGDVTEEVPVLDLRIKDALKGVAPPDLLPHGVPIADLRLKERMLPKKEMLTVAAPYRVDLMNAASRTVLYRPGREQAMFEQLLALKKGAKNLSDEDKEALGMGVTEARDMIKGLEQAENAVLIYGSFVLASSEAAQAAHAFAEAVGAKVMIMGPMANSYGLESLGVLPDKARNSYPAMLQGGVKAAILSGLNPARDGRLKERLEGLELLVVHDLFETETTALADVVLPAKSGYEKEGTTVNLEGRYLQVNAAPVEGGLAEDFSGLVKAFGETITKRLEGRSLRSARRHLKNELDLDLSDLPEEGMLRPGALRDHTLNLIANQPDDANVIITPSMVRGEYLSRCPHLLAAQGGAKLYIHPADAALNNVDEGDEVRLELGSITREAQVRLRDDLPEGMMRLSADADQPPGLAKLTRLEQLERFEVA